jgi:uncharacterized protein (TIGR03067 family)
LEAIVVRTLVACVAVFAASLAHAEVLELEGTVKSVDPASRSISIVRKTPKGEKVLELEVAKNAGDISGFKEGDPVAFAYNPDVDIISKIEKGMSENASADLKVLQGKWVATTLVISGAKLTKGEMQRHSRTFVIEGPKYTETIYRDGKVLVVSGAITLSPETKAIDFDGELLRKEDSKTFPHQQFGFYEIAGDKLKLTWRKKLDGTARPKTFGEEDEGKAWTNSFILERDK